MQQRAAAIPAASAPMPELESDPAGSGAVLIAVGDGGSGAAFALAVRPPGGEPYLVMIPSTLLVHVPGFGEFSMAEALGFGGPELASLALANEMGVRIDDLVAVPAGHLTARGNTLVVAVPVELFVIGADGSRRLIPPGRQELAMDLVEMLLLEQGEGDQFDWLRRQEAVWRGMMTPGEAGDTPLSGMVPRGAPPETVALMAEMAGQTLIVTPPVDRVAIGGGRDGLMLSRSRVEAFLDERLGHLALREGRRPRVEILNGNGVARSGVAVAATLIAEGFHVVRSANADRFDYGQSRVFAQGDAAVAAALEAADLLGIVAVLLEVRAPSAVVDVSIIVGTDLAYRED